MERVMDRQEIYQRIDIARKALYPHRDVSNTDNRLIGNGVKSVDDAVTEGAKKQYLKEAARIFGIKEKITNGVTVKGFILPKDASIIIKKVQTAKTKSTLRKRGRSIRFASSTLLKPILKEVDDAQRNKDWDKVVKLISDVHFEALTKLAGMLPAEYDNQDWKATRRRKGKKSSLKRLPVDWREKMAAMSHGQFRLPSLVCLMTGCRPSELQTGISLELIKDEVHVHIIGAKVKQNAGQPFRKFVLADHPITDLIKDYFKESSYLNVKVDKGNSVTTHLREIGKKIWPRRKEAITCYSARHAMSADCKLALSLGGVDEDFVSEVLGHVVDKTASFYGNRFQSSGISVAPKKVNVPVKVKQKARSRNLARANNGKIPSQKQRKSVDRKSASNIPI